MSGKYIHRVAFYITGAMNGCEAGMAEARKIRHILR